MKIKVTEKKVLARKVNQETQTEAGILLTTTHSFDSNPVMRAEVLVVGDELPDVNVGDHILYQRGGESEYTPSISKQQEKLLFIPWQYILGVIPKEEL